MSSTVEELRRIRRACSAVARHTGHYVAVTKMQRLSHDTEYLETEWQVFAHKTPSLIDYMALSRVSEADVLALFTEAQCSFVEKLDEQLVQAKEAYERATGVL